MREKKKKIRERRKERQEKKVEGACPASLGLDFNFSGVPVPRKEGWKQPCVGRVGSAEVGGEGVSSPCVPMGCPLPGAFGWFRVVDGVPPGANLSAVCWKSLET